MSFLSRLFGSRGGSSAPKDVEAELKKLEKEAEKARPGYVGSAYNRAGDLALRDQQTDRALGYYGRAIDAFLEDSQREAARGVANKIIRVRPSAVRTLCTLTWLDLAARHHAMALLHLRDYASAAHDAGEQARAATQIHKMAELADDAEFLDAAADALDSLDFGNRAKEVRGWAKSGAPEATEDGIELAGACLRAAVASNDPEAQLLVDDFVAAPEGDDEADAEAEAGGPDEAEAGADAEDGREDDEAATDEVTIEDQEDGEEEEDEDEVEEEDEEVARAGDPSDTEGEAEGGEGEREASAPEAEESEAEESEDVEPEPVAAEAEAPDAEASSPSTEDGSSRSRKGRKSRKGRRKKKKR